MVTFIFLGWCSEEHIHMMSQMWGPIQFAWPVPLFMLAYPFLTFEMGTPGKYCDRYWQLLCAPRGSTDKVWQGIHTMETEFANVDQHCRAYPEVFTDLCSFRSSVGTQSGDLQISVHSAPSQDSCQITAGVPQALMITCGCWALKTPLEP